MKKITLHNIYLRTEYCKVPVMRNGKPTKRMKEVEKNIFGDAQASAMEIDGHIVYVRDDKDWDWGKVAYRADGTRIAVAWQFGWSGTENHWLPLILLKDGSIEQTTQGYDGAQGKGRGARIKFIDWDGTKYQKK